MDLLELGLLWPLCGGHVIGRETAWRGVCRGAFLPRSGEPRRIAFLAHATKSNRYIGPVLAAKLGTLTIIEHCPQQMLRHKRALKALPGTAAETTMGFMRRNRAVARQQYTSYLNTREASGKAVKWAN
jgi:hypothetical protein